ncbi:hypothetical protein FQZ97_1047870 [compost metagenome]
MRVITGPTHFIARKLIDLVNPPNLHPAPDDMACPFCSFETPAFCRLLNRPKRSKEQEHITGLNTLFTEVPLSTTGLPQ